MLLKYRIFVSKESRNLTEFGEGIIILVVLVAVKLSTFGDYHQQPQEMVKQIINEQEESEIGSFGYRHFRLNKNTILDEGALEILFLLIVNDRKSFGRVNDMDRSFDDYLDLVVKQGWPSSASSLGVLVSNPEEFERIKKVKRPLHL